MVIHRENLAIKCKYSTFHPTIDLYLQNPKHKCKGGKWEFCVIWLFCDAKQALGFYILTLCTRSKGEEYPFVKAANIEAGTYTLNLDLINFAAPSYTMLM